MVRRACCRDLPIPGEAKQSRRGSEPGIEAPAIVPWRPSGVLPGAGWSCSVMEAIDLRKDIAGCVICTDSTGLKIVSINGRKVGLCAVHNNPAAIADLE